MKARLLLLLFSPLLFAGCAQEKPSGSIPTVDVTASYPEKTITLQDFADVEYIPLETSDEFLTEGVILASGEKYILVKNSSNDGNIYLFDRTGKGVRVINHKGNGPGEYTNYNDVLLDEANDEFLVGDLLQHKMFVYNMKGKFKRSFSFPEESGFFDIINLDDKHFIFWNNAADFNQTLKDATQFYICSKLDGRIMKEINFPYKERKSTMQIKSEGTYNVILSFLTCFNVNRYRDQVFLTEPSCDTIYSYSRAGIEPAFARTPSIQSMSEETFLFPGIFTDDYAFFAISEKKENGKHVELLYDQKEQTFYTYLLQNNDYKDCGDIRMFQMNTNRNIYFAQCLYPHLLVEANAQGKLSGKLKELVDTLDEEDNPVVMIVKPKK